MTEFKAAHDLIVQSKKVLIVTHVNPDGDAWCSLSAFILILDRLGVTYQAFCADKPTGHFSSFAGIDRVINDKSLIDWNNCDVIVTLDCASFLRSGLGEEITNRGQRKLIEIDHHPVLDQKAEISLRFPKSAATCQVLYDFVKANQITIDARMATSLLAGMATDTGNFLYTTASDKTMSAAAELLRLGARLDAISCSTWKNRSVAAMKLWGVAMSRLVLDENKKIAFTYLRQIDFQEAGASEDELEDLAGFLSGLSDAEALLLLKESDGLVKGSWRSNTLSYDVSVLAREMGGGGHARAAGFAVPGRLIISENNWEIEKIG